MFELTLIGYRSKGLYCALPGWAQYLVDLGRFVVTHSPQDKRLVVGISVPTRAYAAALCGLGVASAAYVDTEKEDPLRHFAWLASLPMRTMLRFRKGDRLHCATFVGVKRVDGEDYLVMSGGYSRRWDKCSDIQPGEPEAEFVRPRVLTGNSEFVAASAPGIDPRAHASHTSTDCLIVGTKDRLRPEMIEQGFVTHATGQTPEQSGFLNDLLRCDEFLLNRNDHDRTKIVSAFKDVPDLIKNSAPPAVVFDGAPGYLHHRSNWRRSARVVIIDRTSSKAVEAAEAVQQECVLDIGGVDMSSVGQPPHGIEITAFYEALR
ncbi:MAG: hypothetical protein EXQ69_09420 [Acidimicrobiia bacterium]|nr:hypothetical protein [Acidimicrobiia bacterium]